MPHADVQAGALPCVMDPTRQRADKLGALAGAHGVTSSGSTGYGDALAAQKDKRFPVFLCYQSVGLICSS